MSFTLSRNLRLRIDSGLTANAKYNLSRIDLLGTSLTTDTTQATALRSAADINIEPQSTASGGSGIGGTLNIGTSTHSLTSVNIYSDLIRLSSALSLKDTNSSFYTALRNTSTGATANNFLTFDTNNANRSVSLSGNLTLAGSFSTSGAFSTTLTATAPTNVTLPTTGLLATRNEIETFTNKTISGTNNTLSNVSLTSAVSDILPISSGGTGATDAVSALIALLPSQVGQAGKVLSTDGTNVSWISPTAGAVSSTSYVWSVGTVFNIIHNLGTTSLDVTVKDEYDDLIFVDIDITSANAITLTSSEAPLGSWTVTIQAAVA